MITCIHLGGADEAQHQQDTFGVRPVVDNHNRVSVQSRFAADFDPVEGLHREFAWTTSFGSFYNSSSSPQTDQESTAQSMYDSEPQVQVVVYDPDDATMSTQINDGSCDFFTHPKPFFESDCHHPVPVTIDELPHPENEVSVRVGRKYCRWRAKTKRVNKYCTTHGCGNISVSRGLCRGHGGGRRCHFAGCAKGAQSCSIFCWAHGGGCRCEVKGCMRSRKSKHFCVDHVKLECTIPTMAIPQALEVPKTTTSASTTQSGSPRLPCLQDALRKAQQNTALW